MVIGICVGDELRHRALFFGRLRVLFAKIPIQAEVVAKAGAELAEVEFAFRAAGAPGGIAGAPVADVR